MPKNRQCSVRRYMMAINVQVEAMYRVRSKDGERENDRDWYMDIESALSRDQG